MSVTILVWLSGFVLGAIIGHRFLPPRVDEQREQMLTDLLAREAARKLRGES
jgi:hypothetical protein